MNFYQPPSTSHTLPILPFSTLVPEQCSANSKNHKAAHESGVLLPLTLVDLQLDAQNSYLFTYNTFIKILYMFRALPCSSSGGLRRNCIYGASATP